MEEPLDRNNNDAFQITNNFNLNRTKFIYKLIFYAFCFSFGMSIMVRGAGLTGAISELLVAGPFFATIILSPIGLFYIIRSYVKKEKSKKQKFLYLSGMLFFNFIILMMILAVFKDILSINK